MSESAPSTTWRSKLHEVIFEADTPAGKGFDLALLLAILASILAVLLDSVPGLQARHGHTLRAAEWAFTVLFTIEYALRLLSVQKPWRYAVSFYGVVDLLAILPTYLSLFVDGTQSLLVIRALRLLRVFRVLKLGHFVREARTLRRALWASSRKIVVFLGTVLTLVLIIGALMYLIEGPEHGFTSIPQSVYWAIVTMTTVGYGDIVPQTIAGRILSSAVMILGYGIIAVPTGIVTTELVRGEHAEVSARACPQCAAEGHDTNAAHCKFCGAHL